MIDDNKFENLILGIPYSNSRLKQLQDKIKGKELKGDEVYEFIHLDRIELNNENESLKNIVLDLLAIEESYEVLEEIGENFHGYIDKHRDLLVKYKP